MGDRWQLTEENQKDGDCRVCANGDTGCPVFRFKRHDAADESDEPFDGGSVEWRHKEGRLAMMRVQGVMLLRQVPTPDGRRVPEAG